MKLVIRYLAVTLAVILMAAVAAPVTHAQMGAKPAKASTRAQRPQKATLTTKVNINSGSVDQLATLPGIGPSAAKKIVDFRSKSGSFKRLEDLMAVKGIGEKKYLKLKDRIAL